MSRNEPPRRCPVVPSDEALILPTGSVYRNVNVLVESYVQANEGCHVVLCSSSIHESSHVRKGCCLY
jgi:hypothetical protein